MTPPFTAQGKLMALAQDEGWETHASDRSTGRFRRGQCSIRVAFGPKGTVGYAEFRKHVVSDVGAATADVELGPNDRDKYATVSRWLREEGKETP